MTVAARRLNRRGSVAGARAVLILAPLAALAGGGLLVLSVLDLSPASHVYPAVICALVIWTGTHVLVGVLMQGYCLAGLVLGKIDPDHDADLWNVSLFWHFHVLTVLVTAAVIGLAPGLL